MADLSQDEVAADAGEVTAPVLELAAEYSEWTRLDAGSFGETWRAREKWSNRLVIIKLRPHDVGDEGGLALHKREAHVMSKIKHPGLQQLLDHRVVGDRLAIIYNYVDGPSLKQVIQKDGHVPLSTALRWGRTLVEALEQIHQVGAVYRDLSPENVILAYGEHPVLIDFNALGELSEDSSLGASTIIGEIAGKFRYMAPEQATGAPQTPAADVYAFGLLLFEMLAGRPLRQETDYASIVQSTLSDTLPDLSSVGPVVRPLIYACLNVDAAERPKTAEVLRQLDEIAAGHTSDDPFAEFSEVLGQPFSSSPAPEAVTVYTKVPAPALARSSGLGAGWLFGVFIFLFLAGAGAYAYFSGALGPGGGGLQGALSNIDYLTLGYFGGGALLLGLATFVGLRFRGSKDRPSSAFDFAAAELVAGPDAYEKVSRTMLVQVDAYAKAAGPRVNQMAAINMAALAKEYAEAESSAERMKALEMIGALHSKLMTQSTPWWRSFDGWTARAITLASVAGGVLALLEGIQRLSTAAP